MRHAVGLCYMPVTLCDCVCRMPSRAMISVCVCFVSGGLNHWQCVKTKLLDSSSLVSAPSCLPCVRCSATVIISTSACQDWWGHLLW